MTPPGVSVWHFIWWLSETSGVGLGRFAPLVFGRMIGRKGERVATEPDDGDSDQSRPVSEIGHGNT